MDYLSGQRSAVGSRLLPFLLLAAVGLTGCGWFHFSGDDKQQVERHLSDAKKLYEQRDYLGAVHAYEEILKIQPRYGRAYLKIGLIYDHNLNDYLSAAYHYRRFLQMSDSDSAEADLAKSSLENATLQFAASVPNSSGQGSPELVRVRSENDALHRQVEELKREIVHLRGKPGKTSTPLQKSEAPILSPAPVQVQPPAPEPPVPKPASMPKTYVVKKGDGIQSIAEKVYGDRSRWREILAANPEVKNPNLLKPGQVLKLPQK